MVVTPGSRSLGWMAHSLPGLAAWEMLTHVQAHGAHCSGSLPPFQTEE